MNVLPHDLMGIIVDLAGLALMIVMLAIVVKATRRYSELKAVLEFMRNSMDNATHGLPEMPTEDLAAKLLKIPTLKLVKLLGTVTIGMGYRKDQLEKEVTANNILIGALLQRIGGLVKIPQAELDTLKGKSISMEMCPDHGFVGEVLDGEAADKRAVDMCRK